MVATMFYVLRTGHSVARFARALWSVGFGLHTLPTLVRQGTVRPAARGCREGRERGAALYRLFAHQAAPGWVESPRGGQAAQAIGRTKGGINPKLAANYATVISGSTSGFAHLRRT